MASDFSIESVKQCILDKGGRIRNHELVTQFKGFLNDPVHKGANREKFKDFVNELATIKVEEGEKVLVLKRKHRPESGSFSSSSVPSDRSSFASNDQAQYQPPPAKSPYLHSDDTSSTSEASYSSSGMQETESPQLRHPLRQSDQHDVGDRDPPYGDAVRSRSEPPVGGDGSPRSAEDVDGMMMSKVYSDENLDVRLKSSTRQNMGPVGEHKASFDASTNSLASSATGSQASLTAETASGPVEEEGNVSVLSIKERVQHLNKISSESDLQQARGASGPTPRKKTMKDRDDDDESHSSGGASYVTLTPEEKEWMLVSATADYHEMFRLLSKNGHLAKVKDISNYTMYAHTSTSYEVLHIIERGVDIYAIKPTALHWASKFGKPEVVKMLANKIGVNVNQRSGYTPLHLAAIHGHEDVIELLVTVYKADANIRDYSGKKAKQYLKNSASSRVQQLLVSTRIGPGDFGSARSLDDSFTRQGTARQSNRARAISSLIQATSSVIRQPMLRSSWEGPLTDSGTDKTPGSTPPGSGPTSPASGRKYKDGKSLMPPPHLPSHRRRRADHSRSSSRESLKSQSQSTGAMDKENTNTQVVPRSESDPTLTQKTFI